MIELSGGNIFIGKESASVECNLSTSVIADDEIYVTYQITCTTS